MTDHTNSPINHESLEDLLHKINFARNEELRNIMNAINDFLHEYLDGGMCAYKLDINGGQNILTSYGQIKDFFSSFDYTDDCCHFEITRNNVGLIICIDEIGSSFDLKFFAYENDNDISMQRLKVLDPTYTYDYNCFVNFELDKFDFARDFKCRACAFIDALCLELNEELESNMYDSVYTKALCCRFDILYKQLCFTINEILSTYTDYSYRFHNVVGKISENVQIEDEISSSYYGNPHHRDDCLTFVIEKPGFVVDIEMIPSEIDFSEPFTETFFVVDLHFSNRIPNNSGMGMFRCKHTQMAINLNYIDTIKICQTLDEMLLR